MTEDSNLHLFRITAISVWVVVRFILVWGSLIRVMGSFKQVFSMLEIEYGYVVARVDNYQGINAHPLAQMAYI